MSGRRAPTDPRIAAAVVLAVGCVGSLIIEFPGTYVYDSFIQLLEGREGSYSFWHPPVMSWLLGLSDRIVPGASVYVVAQTLLGYGALSALVWLPKRVSWAAVAAAAAFCFLPQLFMYQGYVLKDVLFADAVLASFVSLGLSAVFWSSRCVRISLLAAFALFLVLAVLTRQNGMLFLPFGALSLAWIAARRQ